jgi:hypothetical protein
MSKGRVDETRGEATKRKAWLTLGLEQLGEVESVARTFEFELMG